MRLNLKIVSVAVLLLGLPSSLAASKRIVVDLTHQIAIAYQDGRIKFYGRISSGKPGRRTPTGSFYVREKDIDHVSNLWPQPNGGARMPYMLRITRDGIAMHLGPTPDYPASHGCIRMRDGFAQRMYAWAEKWTRVDVIGTPPSHSPAVALPAFARNKAMLHRSIGGGMGTASNFLNTNPKAHQRTTSASTPTVPKRHTRHMSASRVLSTNPKHHKKKIKKVKHSLAKRHHRKRHKTRNRHPNPLKSVSVQ